MLSQRRRLMLVPKMFDITIDESLFLMSILVFNMFIAL